MANRSRSGWLLNIKRRRKGGRVRLEEHAEAVRRIASEETGTWSSERSLGRRFSNDNDNDDGVCRGSHLRASTMLEEVSA